MKARNTELIIRTLRHIAEALLPILFWVLIAFGFDSPAIAILTVLSAVIHELGHIAALVICGKPLKIKGHISGFRIKSEALSYSKDIAVILSGPLASLSVFVLCLPFGKSAGGYIDALGNINLLTALFNLLPIRGYDGYGAIKTLLEMKERSDGLIALNVFSLCATVALTFFALYLLLTYGVGYWIFGLFFALTLAGARDFLRRE